MISLPSHPPPPPPSLFSRTIVFVAKSPPQHPLNSIQYPAWNLRFSFRKFWQVWHFEKIKNLKAWLSLRPSKLFKKILSKFEYHKIIFVFLHLKLSHQRTRYHWWQARSEDYLLHISLHFHLHCQVLVNIFWLIKVSGYIGKKYNYVQ